MEGCKLDLLIWSNILEFEVLFGSVYPTGLVIASEFGEIEFETGLSGLHNWGKVLIMMVVIWTGGKWVDVVYNRGMGMWTSDSESLQFGDNQLEGGIDLIKIVIQVIKTWFVAG